MTKWLDENVIPEKKDDFFRVKSQCFDGNTRDFSNRTEWLGVFFKRGLDSFLYDPVPQSVLNASGIAGRRGRPLIPWYLYAVNPICIAIKLWTDLANDNDYSPCMMHSLRSISRTNSTTNFVLLNL